MTKSVFTPLDGGCFCGAVRYRLNRPPMFVNCCHCRECQKRTGSDFVINALIETSEIEVLQGEPAVFRAPTTSGRAHDLSRCPTCEVTLWSDYGARGWVKFVRVSTLDEPQRVPPDAHIFTASKLPWVMLSPETPAFEIFYDMATQWPAESLARRDAASQTG